MNKKNLFFLAVLLVLILFGSLIFLNRQQQSSVLEGLPNYTDDKEPIVVTGFQYDRQPHLGDPDAKVKVIEFGDFKCPACKKWTTQNFSTFKSEFIDTGKVEFYFMNYAFLDRDSYLAAAAGEAVYKQNNEEFWNFYEQMYQHQGKESEIWATPSYLIQFGKDYLKGIDLKHYEQDVNEHTYLHQVKEDYKIGGYYGVNGTPTFFVNGKILRSMDYAELQAAIGQAEADAE
ncbi:DsbA family protein [Paenibacillus pinistramenti]|uniref:DsbA family protein n=1 Tax=Paenibacillus pinistramenti TaxID=1768003 RepID=UPI001EEFED8E|nr:DsbA family protein [Paenibacillus pinistramenti]